MTDTLMSNSNFTLIAGPCVIESVDSVMMLSAEIKKITDRLGINYFFKASFDKANRTSATKYRGPGLQKGIEILRQVKDSSGVCIATDIHEPYQAEQIAEVADIIQIPAFLCRQTDLLKAAAETGKIINVKKAQFLSPEEMGNVVGKLEYFGNHKIMLCERGTCFGYNNLIVDMTGLVRMKKLGYPVVFDATHSIQISGGGLDYGNSGKSEFVPYLAKAAMATGAVNAVFMEVHDNPEKALCDGSCMLKLSNLEILLRQLLEIKALNEKYDNLSNERTE